MWRSKRKKVFVAETKVLYRPLEVYCPRLKSAGQVSTPRREFAAVLRVGLEERANTGCVNSSVLFKKMMRAHNLHQVFCPLLRILLQGAEQSCHHQTGSTQAARPRSHHRQMRVRSLQLCFDPLQHLRHLEEQAGRCWVQMEGI